MPKATPLRDWSINSYDPFGHAVSSVFGDAAKDRHIKEAKAKGQNGAPGADAQSKSGSGDPGRNRYVRFPR
jgi:hypothetical protein